MRSYLGRFLAWLASHTAGKKKPSLSPKTGIAAAFRHHPVKMIVGALVIAVGVSALVVKAFLMVKAGVLWAFNSPTFLTILAAIIILAIAATLVRKKKAPLKWVLSSLGALVIIWLVVLGYQKWTSRESKVVINRDQMEIVRLRSELNKALTGEKSWTVVVYKDKPHYLPIAVGDSISFNRLDSVAFKVVLPNGRKVDVPLGLTGLVDLPSSARSVSFILEPSSPADSVRIDIHKWRAKWM